MLDGISKLIGSGNSGLTGIVAQIAGLLFVVSMVVFAAVVINFLLKRRDGSAGLEQAKNMLGWSVIAMFVLMAVWGLVSFLSINLGVGVGGCINRPSAVPGVASTANCGGSNSNNNTNSNPNDPTGINGFF